MNPTALYLFVASACETLQHSSNFAEDYCNLKMEFFRLFQDNLVFSTRFGADFFTEVRHYLECSEKLKPLEKGGVLGEYDKNFNTWLDKARVK